MHILLKASALNDGSFQEANDWSCAAVWMPPGKRIDNPWTVFQAGLMGVLFKLGIRGCRVSPTIKCSTVGEGLEANVDCVEDVPRF